MANYSHKTLAKTTRRWSWAICAIGIASFPGPFPAFQCCTLKRGRAWYAKSRAACHDDRSWCGMTRTKSRLIEVNKTGPFLRYPCLLSAINVWFEPSKDRLLLVWQWYNRASCHLLAVALTRPVTFDPRDGLDLLSPSLHHVTSRTRPSHFSACNIEKLGMGLGMGLGTRLPSVWFGYGSILLLYKVIAQSCSCDFVSQALPLYCK